MVFDLNRSEIKILLGPKCFSYSFVCCWYSLQFFSQYLNYTSNLVKRNFVEKEKIYNFAYWSFVQNWVIVFEIKADEHLRVLEKFRISDIFKLGWDSSLFFSKFLHCTKKISQKQSWRILKVLKLCQKDQGLILFGFWNINLISWRVLFGHFEKFEHFKF